MQFLHLIINGETDFETYEFNEYEDMHEYVHNDISYTRGFYFPLERIEEVKELVSFLNNIKRDWKFKFIKKFKHYSLLKKELEGMEWFLSIDSIKLYISEEIIRI